MLAKKQIEAGAIGMTCAKLGEAEVLVEAGSYLFMDTKKPPTKFVFPLRSDPTGDSDQHALSQPGNHRCGHESPHH